MSDVDYFTDGLWHEVVVDIESGGSDRIGRINFTVDRQPDTSSRQLSFTTTELDLIGGKYIGSIGPYMS